MQRIRRFLSITFLGGVTVLLPLAVFFIISQWLLGLVSELVKPLTGLVSQNIHIHEALAFLIVLGILIATFFVVGLVVKTNVGQWFHDKVDRLLLRVMPGYRPIKELVSQVIGGEMRSSFEGEVVLAQLYGDASPASVTAIVTSRHADGSVTVYVPTAPIPTSGLTYHLPASCITPLPNVTVEQAMRTIIACGAGSAELIARSRGTVLEGPGG